MTPPIEAGTPARPDETDTVLIMLTVPRMWRQLDEKAIALALAFNTRDIIKSLAHEVKRWQGVDALDLEGLQGIIDERQGKQPLTPEDAEEGDPS